MKYSVAINEASIVKEGSAISLSGASGFSANLHVNWSMLLRRLADPSDAALDFLVVAAAIYSLDKLVARSKAKDKWTREFTVTIPVASLSKWKKISTVCDECLSFLSGDRWKLRFVRRTVPLIHRKVLKESSLANQCYATGTTACLFSGGLDSFVGAIEWIETNPRECITLVGHHDPSIGGPQSDQMHLLKAIRSKFPSRVSSILAGVGHSGASRDITMRSRSILFVAIGILVADHLGPEAPLLIPENGTIAVNVPLTPSRRGSCSTRTAHPHYLSLLQEWLAGIGLNHPLINPLLAYTKGEVVARGLALNRQLFEAGFRQSVSCAKGGHTSNWVNRSANGCGHCMPCIYRRAALHASNLDDETYGVEVFSGQVSRQKKWDDPTCKSADDLRACLSFLVRKPTEFQIAQMLIANGFLSPHEALQHGSTVYRAMDEIRKLIADKGAADIRRAAGL